MSPMIDGGYVSTSRGADRYEIRPDTSRISNKKFQKRKRIIMYHRLNINGARSKVVTPPLLLSVLLSLSLLIKASSSTTSSGIDLLTDEIRQHLLLSSQQQQQSNINSDSRSLQSLPSDNTCLWNGRTFVRGENLGITFESRCGSFMEYPCFCNPDASNPLLPIDCPYCGFIASSAGSSATSSSSLISSSSSVTTTSTTTEIYDDDDEGFMVCAKHNEEISFVDRNGSQQTCTCHIPNVGQEPTRTCHTTTQDDIPEDEDGEDTTYNDDHNTLFLDRCLIKLTDIGDGVSRYKSYEVGESLGFDVMNRCGPNYPCYCNPNVMPYQIECPYCSFDVINPTTGYLLCAKENEIVSYTDKDTGLVNQCSCSYNNNNNDDDGTLVGGDVPPQSSCITLPENIFPPVLPPDATGGDGDIDNPGNRFCTLELVDGEVVTKNEYDDGDNDGDAVDRHNGSDITRTGGSKRTTLTFAHGESYGDYIKTRCVTGSGGGSDGSSSSTNEFPCKCNVNVENQVECPYCGFMSSSTGELHCARHQETITFVDGSTTRQCTCTIPANFPFVEPIESCTIVDGGGDNIFDDDETTCAYTFPDGFTFYFVDGESFAELVEGPCGDTESYPAFCRINTKSPSTTNSTTDDGTDSSKSDVELKLLNRTTDVNPSDTERNGTRPSGVLFYNDSNVDYPYCIFDKTFSGRVYCARDEEVIDIVDDGNNELTCKCTIDEETRVPRSSCRKRGSATDAPTPSTFGPPSSTEDDDPPDILGIELNTTNIAIASSVGFVVLLLLVLVIYYRCLRSRGQGPRNSGLDGNDEDG